MRFRDVPTGSLVGFAFIVLGAGLALLRWLARRRGRDPR